MNLPNQGLMRIAVDLNIPFDIEAMSFFGEVRRFEGRSLTCTDLVDIDVLWVRSVTKVDENLLKGSRVRFVGTATAGINHLDIPWLAANGIGWTSAPGCNAISVAEYLCSVLAVLQIDGVVRQGMKVGLLGHGHVGQAVSKHLKILGFDVKAYDPIRKLSYPNEGLCEIEELFDVDILSVHVPLTKNVPFQTEHWINRRFLSQFRSGIVLINAARGEVLEQDEVLSLREEGFLSALVMDVFEREPYVDSRVFQVADYVTPHIAGYSWTGKMRGTQMLLKATESFFSVNFGEFRGGADFNLLTANDIWELILKAYDFRSDDRDFRQACRVSGSADKVFDQLRKNYPKRLEFSQLRCELACDGAMARAIGFQSW